MGMLDLFACEGIGGEGYHRAGWEVEAAAGQQIAGAYGGARRDKAEARNVRKGGYVPPDKEVVKALLGVKHDTTWAGLFECIPPAYTEWIGQELFVSTLVGENI